MKKTIKISVLILVFFSLILTFSSCADNKTSVTDTVLYSSTGATPIELGSGNTHFNFSVEDADGTVYNFHIHTDKTIVGEALEELDLIEGNEGEFGVYVNKVNGIYAEYEVTNNYWAFYVNGKYASKGIDMTEISADETYMMKIEK